MTAVQQVQQGDAAATQHKVAGLKLQQPPASVPSMTVWACCASANFWLLFVIFGAGTGCGLMFVNSLGAHAQQRSVPASHFLLL